jgi:hypothetical protein
MLYREIIAVCSQIHTKHINTLCGQNVELLNVKPVTASRNQEAFKGLNLQNFLAGQKPKLKSAPVWQVT